MKNVLLVVDLQVEFKDKDGVYEKILEFVKSTKDYDYIMGTICTNSKDSPFVRYNNWLDCIDHHEPLEYNPDVELYKQGYGLPNYEILPEENHYDIIGFNTDACVLKIALDLFDRNYDIKVLTELCYSSSGADNHNRGVKLLKHLLGDACD